MPAQEQEPLLNAAVNSSSWTQQNSTPATAVFPQQQSSFAPAAHSMYPQLPFPQQGQHYALLGRAPPVPPLQCNGTAPCPIPSTSTSSHHPPQQQQQELLPGWLGPPPPPNRYPSYGSSLQHSCSTSTADLCCSVESMSLGSRTSTLDAAKRYGSAGSTDTVDVLSQRHPSCSSTEDALPESLRHSSCYLSAPQKAAQGCALRYPSIESSSSGRAPSGALGTSAAAGLNSLSSSRADSVSSSSRRYPALPDVSSSCASRVGSVVSDVSQPHLLDGWEVAGVIQQQQEQQQQQQLSIREMLRHPGRSSGLYPVLSDPGEHADPQQQQQQRQLRGEPEQVAPWGFDLQVQIQQLSDLPAVADPYVMVLVHLAGHDEQYRTDPQWSTQRIVYGPDEAFDMTNVQPGCTLRCEVWDKNLLQDDMVGRGTWSFTGGMQGTLSASGQRPPAAAALIGAADGSYTECAALGQDPAWCASADVTLELQHPTRSSKTTGKLQIKVLWRPSQQEGSPRRVGPVRFRQHYCPNAGIFTGQWSAVESMCYSTYKLFLCHISSVFDGVRMRWNVEYDKARMVFQPVPVLGTPVVQVIKQQHSAMYATQAGPSRGGVLRCAGDFFKLFNFGIRGGESRFFTYTLCSDCFRCSETGTNVGTDIMSKHAMHAGGAEEVMYAGEFCIMKCDQAAGGYKLVLDNNSGTYSPHKSKLPLLRQLFTLNFPDMEVEVLDWRDHKLQYYQSLCPSRAAAAAATKAAAATSRAKARQFVAG